MSGQPKKQAIIRELTERARVEIGDDASPLDYGVHWIEGGGTILGLAKSISQASGLTIDRPQVSRVLHQLAADAEQRLALARATGGHSLVETALDETLETEADRDAVARQKLVNEQRWRMAGAWNPELREQRGAQVAISINAAHLDSLRLPSQATARLADTASALVVDAEVVEDRRLSP